MVLGRLGGSSQVISEVFKYFSSVYIAIAHETCITAIAYQIHADL